MNSLLMFTIVMFLNIHIYNQAPKTSYSFKYNKTNNLSIIIFNKFIKSFNRIYLLNIKSDTYRKCKSLRYLFKDRGAFTTNKYHLLI